jgi:tetratricopeptide (TPR) repeat protein
MEKRFESALGVLEKVLDIDSSNAVALSNLQFIKNDLAIRSKLIQAEELIINSDFEAARSMLDEVLKVDARHEEALVALALVESHEGNHDAALKSLQKVLNANPGNEDALQLMERLLIKR